ncbi:MAG: Ni/Fe hydrogenase subunit alpha [Pseudomonadota bacterium]
MIRNADIHVHHLTRVEGHGNIVVNVKSGRVEKCEWQVPEAPRFFEAMVRGRHYSEVARITSRICGICSIGHTLASLKATEDALGIQVSEQTFKLRQILKHAENFDSHILHSLFLASPDLVGQASVFKMIPAHAEVVKTALRLKRFAHEWGSLIGGRTTHPTKAVPGGFASLSTNKELKNLKDRFLKECLPDVDAVLDLVLSLKDKFPAFVRETEYMALHSEVEYGLYDGLIQTVLPDGSKGQWPVKDYRECTNEYVVPQSTAKYTKNKLDSYMAGALARFNNNYEQLRPEAQMVAKALGMKPPVFNPYLNTAAQVVEAVHSVHETLCLLEELLTKGIVEEEPKKPTRHGEGFGAVEVPRGILFHSYVYDKDCMCQGGDCIIPTNQNHANIQRDFDKLVPELIAQKNEEKEMELALEMLVRAYDPCISCSTHYLDVTFVR